MQDLIERLERATGPSRELDALVWDAVIQDGRPLVEFTDGSWGKRDPFDGCAFDTAAAYTESIDAALTLVPGGSQYWSLSHQDDWATNQQFRAAVSGHKPIRGATPAIALCIAALRARAASAKQE